MAEQDSEPLTGRGQRVWVSPARVNDVEDYRLAMEASARRIGLWNPVNPRDLVHHLEAQSERHRTFLIRAREPRQHAPLVGCVNVSNVVRGRFMSATLGYNAFNPYAGAGLFKEGLALVVEIVFSPSPQGMGLHRLEANVQIGNSRSAGLLRSLGFRRERTVRRMLWLADGLAGPSAWRDHDSYAVTREEWPTKPFAPQPVPSGVLIVGEEVPRALLAGLSAELGAAVVVDIPFELALPLCAASSAPILWAAGASTDRALDRLARLGIRATSIDHEVRAVCVSLRQEVPPESDEKLARAQRDLSWKLTAQDVTSLALAVRPYLT